jgi:hypothetical protein
MAMAGVGTGLLIGPLAVQARFSQPIERNAVVSALTLFVSSLLSLSTSPHATSRSHIQFRSFGGTVGLAQCAAVLNGKVTSYIRDLVESGHISAQDAAAVSQAAGAGFDSSSGINGLPQEVQGLVRDAFRQGSRWAFLSLVPWCGLAFLVSLMLSKIPDGDAEPKATSSEAKDEGPHAPELKPQESMSERPVV